ncbi:MAG TPA: CPBP family intramembrane glutamic endopeptidase [Candidatus Limnocylindria bacterium]|nr:CPBP family intramembrane glutamic endopeptidase [Candidatus Limnocylindria bacterium]
MLPGGSPAFAAAGLALVAALLVAGRALGLPLRSVTGRPGVSAAAAGAAAGALLAAASVALLRLAVPAVTGMPVAYEPLTGIALPELAAHALVLVPLGVVVPEELAFRGTLLAALRREHATATAIVLSGAAFAAWHVVVVIGTVARTTLAGSAWSIPAVLIGLIVVFAGGVVLALLRVRTDALASSIAAHWAYNAFVLVALWWTAGRG